MLNNEALEKTILLLTSTNVRTKDATESLLSVQSEFQLNPSEFKLLKDEICRLLKLSRCPISDISNLDISPEKEPAAYEQLFEKLGIDASQISHSRPNDALLGELASLICSSSFASISQKSKHSYSDWLLRYERLLPEILDELIYISPRFFGEVFRIFVSRRINIVFDEVDVVDDFTNQFLALVRRISQENCEEALRVIRLIFTLVPFHMRLLQDYSTYSTEEIRLKAKKLVDIPIRAKRILRELEDELCCFINIHSRLLSSERLFSLESVLERLLLNLISAGASTDFPNYPLTFLRLEAYDFIVESFKNSQLLPEQISIIPLSLIDIDKQKLLDVIRESSVQFALPGADFPGEDIGNSVLRETIATQMIHYASCCWDLMTKSCNKMEIVHITESIKDLIQESTENASLSLALSEVDTIFWREFKRLLELSAEKLETSRLSLSLRALGIGEYFNRQSRAVGCVAVFGIVAIISCLELGLLGSGSNPFRKGLLPEIVGQDRSQESLVDPSTLRANLAAAIAKASISNEVLAAEEVLVEKNQATSISKYRFEELSRLIQKKAKAAPYQDYEYGNITGCLKPLKIDQPTIASNALPCGSHAVVLNPRNRKAMVVEVSDVRGPGDLTGLSASAAAWNGLELDYGDKVGLIPVSSDLEQRRKDVLRLLNSENTCPENGDSATVQECS